MQSLQTATSTFADDIRRGLSETPKRLFARYFYDDEGSRLFERIMELPEYYPTRAEAEVLTKNKALLLANLPGSAPLTLVDLGAGDGDKTLILLEHFVNAGLDFSYQPVDISGWAVKDLTQRLHRRLPSLRVEGIIADYETALTGLQNRPGRKLVLFLGSNIGNFAVDEACSFLQRIRRVLSPPDGLLIGMDLRKEPELIHRAYNDSAGITAAFNKNLLKRINRELDGDFNPETFAFHASYEPVSGVVKSYLVSTIAQTVWLGELGQEFQFAAWETIHTEDSRKFSLPEIEALAQGCGFRVEEHFLDGNRWFADSLWRVS